MTREDRIQEAERKCESAASDTTVFLVVLCILALFAAFCWCAIVGWEI